MWLISTAGDSSSDLLRSYREAAVAAPDGDVLLLEWSAPPEADWQEPASWRWASPEWTDRREEFTRSRSTAMPQAAFRSQYLNQWTMALNGWLPAGVWAACGAARVAAPKPKDQPVVALETGADGRVFGVSAWRRGKDKIAVRSHVWPSPDQAWRDVERLRPSRLLLVPELVPYYGGRAPVQTVGTREARLGLGAVERVINDRRLVYSQDDHTLTAHMLAAVARSNQDGTRSLSPKHSPGPIELAKCVVWTVAETLKPASPRPVVVAG